MTKSSSKTIKNGRWHWLLAVACLLIGIVFGRIITPKSTHNHENTVVQNQEKKAVMAVEAVTPSQIEIKNSLVANGIIAATKTAQVSGRLTGVVVERILVDVGDFVKAGQVLAILDTKTIQEQIAQAQADLMAALATKEHAQAMLARLEPLLEIDAVSRQEVDAQRTALKQANANIDAAQARLNTSKNQLSNTKITAPISGVISEKSAQVGVLTTGSTLFGIVQTDSLEWQANVSAKDAQKITTNQEVQLDVNSKAIIGRVIKFSPMANEAREVTVHVRLSKDSRLQIGSYQSGEFILQQQTALAVPVGAVMNHDGYDYVWVLQAQADSNLYQVKRVKVQSLGQKDNMMAVDLPAQTLVVAQAVHFLEENDFVELANINAILGD